MRIMNFLTVVLLAAVLCVGPAEATRNTVAALGSTIVQVPAGQSINVFSWSGATRVFKQTGGMVVGLPTRYEEEATSPVVANEVTFGPYTAATKVRIDAGPQGAWYNVGALAVANPILSGSTKLAATQFAPVAYNAAASFVSNDIMKGLITTTQATGGTIALTLPTGALLDAASGLKVNQAFEWTLINLSGTPATNTATVTASSGHTIVGEAIVGTATIGTNSSTWVTRKTAADTFVTYRKN